eukprot:1158368-Pelagomonas_calceolata.AAC.7
MSIVAGTNAMTHGCSSKVHSRQLSTQPQLTHSKIFTNMQTFAHIFTETHTHKRLAKKTPYATIIAHDLNHAPLESLHECCTKAAHTHKHKHTHSLHDAPRESLHKSSARAHTHTHTPCTMLHGSHCTKAAHTHTLHDAPLAAGAAHRVGKDQARGDAVRAIAHNTHGHPGALGRAQHPVTHVVTHCTSRMKHMQ